MEELDYKSWLQGLYIHDGNGKLMNSLKQLLLNIVAMFTKNKKDTTEIDTYPKKPYGELEKDKTNQEKNKKINYKEYENSLMYYGTMKQRYLESKKNKNMKGE